MTEGERFLITTQAIKDAQTSWATALVAVGQASSVGDAHARTVQLVETHYKAKDGSLLFCPTKASLRPFRRTLEDTVSYFVGQDGSEDVGFALEPWTSVRFENIDILLRGDVGIAMGNYFFERADGSELKAEYSFVYVLDDAGQLKIQLHHSSLPYPG